MKRAASIADDLLLWGVIAVVAILAFGIVGALISTVMFAVKIIVVVVAVGIGLKVVGAVTGGAKRRELDR